MNKPLTLNSLPLFPLHTILFPGGRLPLRVFEVRYRDMVRRCQEAGAPFGVVMLTIGKEVRVPGQPLEQFHHVGTLARIDSVQPLSVGVELMQCTGQTRFRIQDTRQLPHGLWIADVELLPADKVTPLPSDLQHAASALRQVLRKLPASMSCPQEEHMFEDCGWVANRWCELLPMDDQLQLRLLELDSPLLRLELVTDALERSGIVKGPCFKA